MGQNGQNGVSSFLAAGKMVSVHFWQKNGEK
jgi:hypothetical protein